MTQAIEFLWREAFFLVVLAALGSAPASFLSKRFSTLGRVTMAPALGLCLGTAACTCILWFLPADQTPWMDLVYEPDQLWAEADIDQAARWMRMLYEDPALRSRIGSAGAATIEARYNPAAAGAAAANRLAEISRIRPRPERRSGST